METSKTAVRIRIRISINCTLRNGNDDARGENRVTIACINCTLRNGNNRLDNRVDLSYQY